MDKTCVILKRKQKYYRENCTKKATSDQKPKRRQKSKLHCNDTNHTRKIIGIIIRLPTTMYKIKILTLKIKTSENKNI